MYFGIRKENLCHNYTWIYRITIIFRKKTIMLLLLVKSTKSLKWKKGVKFFNDFLIIAVPKIISNIC